MSKYGRLCFAVVLALWPAAWTPAVSRLQAQEHAASSRPAPVYALPEDGGDSQSPINILTGTVEPGHHDIALRYISSEEHLLNTGHTIEADFDAGSRVEFDGKVYELKQLHFHTPSEHQIDGITYPLELHMVHTLREDSSKYLVIAVMFRDGASNALIGEVVAHAPHEAGQHYDAMAALNAMDILGSIEDGYYHYEGSLTTPPYTETVTWLVMKNVHQAGSAQIQALNMLEGNNARHIQSLHARRVDGENGQRAR